MTVKKIDLPEALERGRKLPFAWVRSLSFAYVGRNKEIEDELEEVEEARFFDEKTEIKILRTVDGLQAWCCEAEPDDHVLEHSYKVRNPEFGKEIRVTWMLDVDEDGQTYISGGRLSGWKEK